MGIVVDMKPYKRGSTSAKETFSVRVRVINKVSFLDFHGAMLHYEAAKGLPVSLPNTASSQIRLPNTEHKKYGIVFYTWSK